MNERRPDGRRVAPVTVSFFGTAVGVALTDFDTRAPDAFRKARGWQSSFTSPSSIAALLEDGMPT